MSSAACQAGKQHEAREPTVGSHDADIVGTLGEDGSKGLCSLHSGQHRAGSRLFFLEFCCKGEQNVERGDTCWWKK